MPRPLDIWPADDGAGCQLPFQSKTSVCLCSCAITTWFSNSLVRSGSYTFHWMLLSSSSLQKRSNQLDLVISTLVLLLGRVDMPARLGWGVYPGTMEGGWGLHPGTTEGAVAPGWVDTIDWKGNFTSRQLGVI